MQSDPLYRWIAFCDLCPWTKGSLDVASWRALLRAGTLGVREEAALTEISSRIVAAGGVPRPGKLRQQLARAYGFAAAHPVALGEPLPPPKPVVTFDLAKLERLASRLQQPSDWVTTLAAVSRLSPAGQSPAAALRALYRAGERVLIFHGNPYTQGDHLYEVPETGTMPREIPGQYLSHPEGVWFLIQPVSGQTYLNPRTGTRASGPRRPSVLALCGARERSRALA